MLCAGTRLDPCKVSAVRRGIRRGCVSPLVSKRQRACKLKVEGDLNRKVRCHASVVLVNTFSCTVNIILPSYRILLFFIDVDMRG